MKSIKEADAADIARTIHLYYGIMPSVDDMCVVMNNLLTQREAFWMEELRSRSYSDTMPREMILEEIAQTFLKRSWPCFGDEASEINFFDQLKTLCETRGWKHNL